MKTIMDSYKHSVTVNNKRCTYTITPIDRNMIHFECKEARISQEFLAEDIPNLLFDLPEIIVSVTEYHKKQNETIRFRVSAQDKKNIQKKAIKAGFSTISAFLRDLALGT